MNAPLPEPEKPRFIEEAIPPRIGVGKGGAQKKLTASQVAEIRCSDAKGCVLAERFGVTDGVISRIRLNYSYHDPDYDPADRLRKTSRIKGVYFDASNGRWRALTQKDGRKTYHGYFRTEQEAAEALGRAIPLSPWEKATRHFTGAGYAAAYRDAELLMPESVCPMEAGIVGRLADGECEHGRLPGDRTDACGCWKGM